jgi:hypothetical protein
VRAAAGFVNATAPFVHGGPADRPEIATVTGHNSGLGFTRPNKETSR